MNLESPSTSTDAIFDEKRGGSVSFVSFHWGESEKGTLAERVVLEA
jgi:hypothetical protein